MLIVFAISNLCNNTSINLFIVSNYKLLVDFFLKDSLLVLCLGENTGLAKIFPNFYEMVEQ